METQGGVLVPQPETLVLALGDLGIVCPEASTTPATSSLRARAAPGRICGVLGRVPTRGWTGPSHVRTCPLRPPRPTLHVCDGFRPMVYEPLKSPRPRFPPSRPPPPAPGAAGQSWPAHTSAPRTSALSRVPDQTFRQSSSSLGALRGRLETEGPRK